MRHAAEMIDCLLMISADDRLYDLYAQCVSSRGIDPACEEFFRLIHPVFNRVVCRVARQFQAVNEVDDVLQEIRLKVATMGQAILPSLPREPSTATAYFSVLAANSARDFFRARNASKRGAQRMVSLDVSLASVAEALGVQHPMDRDILIAQIEGYLPADRREQSVFRLYYRQGFTAKEIAAIPVLDLTVKGVESMVHRISLQIRARMRSAESSAPEKGETAADSSLRK